MTGGELISQIIQDYGVGTAFSVAGASHTHLLDPLDRAGVTIVSNRHESGAVGSADGYARVKGTLGVALIVADQGLPNAVGGLAVAWHACSPVLVLVASPPVAFAEADRAIDQDQLSLVTPLSKWARTIPSAERLEDYLVTGIKHALSGRPGPVVLLVPEHLLSAAVEKAAWQTPGLPAPAASSSDSIAALVDLLRSSRQPMIIAGAGAAWGNAGPSLTRLACDFGIPVLANGLGRGQVAEDNQVSFAWPYAQLAACKADLVIVAGARLTQRLGLGLPPRFAPDARFAQIDIDPSAFHRNRPIDVVLQGDVGLTLRALVAAMSSERLPSFDPGWLSEALSQRKIRVAELSQRDGPAIHPLRLGAEIMSRMPDDAVYVGDGADIQCWMYGAIRILRPRGFLDHHPMGAMGSGTALAVGAAAALKEVSPGKTPPVVLVTGDGAIGFHPAELHAAARANLRLTVIVGNDGAWGTEMHGQRQVIGRAVNTELGTLPYEHLGVLFGGSGVAVNSLDELRQGLDRAFAIPGLCVVNVVIDSEAGAELKSNPAVRMILFSDLVEGQKDIRRLEADS